MAFITITTDKGLAVDDSDWSEESLIEGFLVLLEKGGFDKKKVSCGVTPSPDFGYFELADRFWRASLSIYFFGVTGCFWERGAGYPEPWLFNVRHSIELYLKGFLLYAVWLEEVQADLIAPGHRKYLRKLKNYFKNPHDLFELYMDYQNKLKAVIKKWNVQELSTAPELDKMLLSAEGEELLKEIDEADKTSFRFRYPSLNKNRTDYLQELKWHYDEKQLLPKTGLPKEAGYFFDHQAVINSLHKLRQEMRGIESYLGACWDYIGQAQDIALDLMREFYTE